MILGRLAAPIRVAFLVTSLRDLPLNASRYLRAFFPLVYAVFVMGGSSARAEVPLEVSLVTGKPQSSIEGWRDMFGLTLTAR